MMETWIRLKLGAPEVTLDLFERHAFDVAVRVRSFKAFPERGWPRRTRRETGITFSGQ